MIKSQKGTIALILTVPPLRRHSLKTIAPEKVPLMLLTWAVFAVGPWGMGCSVDRPTQIFLYTPDITI